MLNEVNVVKLKEDSYHEFKLSKSESGSYMQGNDLFSIIGKIKFFNLIYCIIGKSSLGCIFIRIILYSTNILPPLTLL